MRIFLIVLVLLAPQVASAQYGCRDKGKEVHVHVWELADFRAEKVGDFAETARDYIDRETKEAKARNWSAFTIRHGRNLRDLHEGGKLAHAKIDFTVRVEGRSGDLGELQGYPLLREERGKNGYLKIVYTSETERVQELGFEFPDLEKRIVSPPVVPNPAERFRLAYTGVWRTNCIVHYNIVVK